MKEHNKTITPLFFHHICIDEINGVYTYEFNKN
ncbi:hypothetical protein Metlim_0639 [Methanoplanus limicola DSM 2279]|uniref:Uncharacterized protein n=1 Tax=Methanoplanus limicola DSM 2279 TaxID=937775 RepID=H1Z3G9_9EURY|nr:hypothetical protein Metlim_0639 [Methanoplanus limicola DSM 2279]